MTSWLLEQTLITSVLFIFLGLFRQPLRRFIGTKGAYLIWLILPLQALIYLFFSEQQIPSQLHVNPTFLQATDWVRSYDSSVASSFWVEFVWLTGAAICAVLMSVFHVYSMSQFRLARLDEHQKASLLKTSLSSKKKTLPSVKLFSSNQVHTPMVAGIIEKKLVFPTSFFALNTRVQRMILEHEFTHLRRGDLYWNLLALGFLCLFWFNPIIWWAMKHFRQSQEIACDAEVLKNKTFSERAEYAKTFLSQSVINRYQPLTALSYSGKQSVKERLLNIQHGYAWRWTLFPIATLLLFTTLSIQAITIGSKATAQYSVMPIYRAMPLYPEEAAMHGIEGDVTLSFSINPNGSVSNVEIVDATHAGVFDQSALDAVTKWQYSKVSRTLHNQRVVLNYLLDES